MPAPNEPPARLGKVPAIPPRPKRSAASSPRRQMAKEPPAVPPSRPSTEGRPVDPALITYSDQLAASLEEAGADPSQENQHDAAPSLDTHAGGSGERPHVTRLPSVGQEGFEYSLLDRSLKEQDDGPTSVDVTENLPVHAPKALFPDAGKLDIFSTTTTTTPGDDPIGRSSELASLAASRPTSAMNGEGRIPEIGLQAPLIPHAGDVQAPTAAGLTVNHTGSSVSSNMRPRMDRQYSNDPVMSRFEQDWYEKHPEEAIKEEAFLIPGPREGKERGMSRSELEAIVRQRSFESTTTGTPNEEIAGMAFDAHNTSFRSRSRLNEHTDAGEHQTQTAETDHNGQQEDIIVHNSDPSGWAEGDTSKDHRDEETSFGKKQNDYPILAEDEQLHEFHQKAAIARDPHHLALENESSQPDPTRPLSPQLDDSKTIPVTPPVANSAPADEQIERDQPVPEYKPLFEDDDEDTRKEKEAHNAHVDERRRHHFPSKDVWEDAPSSHRLEATVDRPQSPIDTMEGADGEAEETTNKEDRSDSLEEEEGPKDDPAILPEHLERLRIDQTSSGKGPALHTVHKFPSKDIWEDAADHSKLVATVDAPQSPDYERDRMADEDELAESTSKPVSEQVLSEPKPKSETDFPDKGKNMPPIPSRPAKKPNLSEKAKPSIAPRLPSSSLAARSRALFEAQNESVSPPKPRPAIPTRPAGSKIAALKAGFMKDLNSKLQVGPQPQLKKGSYKVAEDESPGDSPAPNRPSEEEDDPEAAIIAPPEPARPIAMSPSSLDQSSPATTTSAPKPLSDIRSGRVRGPPRRLPTKQAEPKQAETKPEVVVSKLSIGPVYALYWTEGDDIVVPRIHAQSGPSKTSQSSGDDRADESPKNPPVSSSNPESAAKEAEEDNDPDKIVI